MPNFIKKIIVMFCPSKVTKYFPRNEIFKGAVDHEKTSISRPTGTATKRD